MEFATQAEPSLAEEDYGMSLAELALIAGDTTEPQGSTERFLHVVPALAKVDNEPTSEEFEAGEALFAEVVSNLGLNQPQSQALRNLMSSAGDWVPSSLLSRGIRGPVYVRQRVVREVAKFLAESDYSDQLTTTGKRSTFRYRWLGPTLPTEEYDTAAEAAERADKEAALETKDAALLGQYGLGLSVNGHRQLSVGDTPLRLDEHAVATVIALARRGGRATFRELEKEPALSKLAPRRIVEKLTDSLARIEPTMQANGIHFRNLRIPAGGNKVIRSIALGDYEQTQKLAVGSGEKESTAKIPARERRELRLAKFMQWATDVVEMAPDWSLSAACRGQDIKKYFVPGAASNSKDAKKDCQRCPVSVQCLASALINEEERGVFGGLTDRERKAVLNRVMSYGVRMGLDKIIQYQGGLKADGYRHAAARQETAEATI